MRHAHALQDRARPGQRVVGGQAQVQRAERHVFQNRGHEQLLVGILKHHADLGADLFERCVRQRQTADFDGTFASQQSVQVQDEGGLAGSVGAEQRHGFSGVEMKVDAIERLSTIGILVAQSANCIALTHSSMRMARHPARHAEKNSASDARNGAGAAGTKRPRNPRASMA